MGKRGLALFCSFLRELIGVLRDFDRRCCALFIQVMPTPFFRRFFRAVGMPFAHRP
jgi:hypothetical protein